MILHITFNFSRLRTLEQILKMRIRGRGLYTSRDIKKCHAYCKFWKLDYDRADLIDYRTFVSESK